MSSFVRHAVPPVEQTYIQVGACSDRMSCVRACRDDDVEGGLGIGKNYLRESSRKRTTPTLTNFNSPQLSQHLCCVQSSSGFGAVR